MIWITENPVPEHVWDQLQSTQICPEGRFTTLLYPGKGGQ